MSLKNGNFIPKCTLIAGHTGLWFYFRLHFLKLLSLHRKICMVSYRIQYYGRIVRRASQKVKQIIPLVTTVSGTGPVLPIPLGSNDVNVQCCQGRNHVFKVGVQFLSIGYCYPSTEKNRQVYSVWCRRLHNHTLFIKKLCKKLGVRPKFGEVRTPRPRSGCTCTHECCE